MEQAVTYFGNDGLRMPTGGCSAVMSGGVYGRNYDFRPRGYEARFALVQVRGSYASIGGSHQLTGRLDGMNEHGLAIGLHLVKARPRSPGLTSVLLVRRVLDSCATTAEAIALLRRTPHAMQYNYSLLDAGGVAAVVEAGAGAVAVRGGDWLACTNHFQTPQLRRLNRRVAHSIDRLPPLEGWAAREPQCRTDIHSAEPFRLAGLPQLRQRPDAAHPRRRAGQPTAPDRHRRQCRRAR